jgi:hypothetical protein
MPQSTTTGVVVEIKADMEFLNAAGKAYKGTRFTYSDDRSGDIKAQKFHENVMKYSPEVAKGLNTLVKDDEFTMVKEKKEGSDFWNAISISKGRDTGVVNTAAPTAGKAAPTKPFVSTYETKEERAIRQRLIVAQSSLSTAIGCLSDKDKLSEKKVFATAENIFQWVMTHKEEVVDGNDVEMGEMT